MRVHHHNSPLDAPPPPLRRPKPHPWVPILRAGGGRALVSPAARVPLSADDSAAVRRAARAADGSRTWVELAQDPQAARGLALLHHHGALLDADDVAGGPALRARERGLLDRGRLSLAATGQPSPGAIVARRRSRVVQVFGGGGVGRELADVLSRCGLDASVAGPRTTPDDSGIVVGVGPRSWPELQRWMADGITHLAVSPRAASVRVGPLVVPQRTACLQCLQVTRAERRPHWPVVDGQLPSVVVPQPDPLLVHHAAALAARGLVSFTQAGTSEALGAYWEVSLDDPVARRTTVERHPLCGCWWPTSPPPTAPVRNGQAHRV